jgi:hypothetical protein
MFCSWIDPFFFLFFFLPISYHSQMDALVEKLA